MRMKSNANEGFAKEIHPEQPLLAPKQDLDFASTEAPVSGAKAKLAVGFPSPPELPLPIVLASVSLETRVNTLRDFGINE